nr:hypothetical protein [Tanacetum cinerariifolium]
MATTIEQQVALDEALVPSTKRLRIGRSNFILPSDIQSKESTLQVVYDVLRRCPFFQAFLVTADEDFVYHIEHKKQKKGIEMITAAAKGKQPAKARSSSDLSKAARTEAKQLKIVLRRSRQETHISQRGGSSTDEGTGSKLGVSDVPYDESEE